MTMVGATDGSEADVLDLADVTERYCVDAQKGLRDLFLRLAFDICSSNTDNHLRNYGFLLAQEGWTPAPSFDVNPDIEKTQMSLSMDGSPDKNPGTLLGIATFFRLSKDEGRNIIRYVQETIRDHWKEEASRAGIPRNEQNRLEEAFALSYEKI